MSIFEKTTAISIDQSGLINTLRSNLESYPEDSVLREMLQNADDGGATHFSVIYKPQNKNNENQDAFANAARLVVLNDGDVNDDQFKAMTQLRAASQVDDSSKIGKFGLGLKSVFHWCDIFWIFRITPNADETQWTLERFETVTLPGIEFKNVISAAAIEAVYDDVKRQVLSCQLPIGAKPLLVFVLPLRDEATVRVLEANNSSPLAAITHRFPAHLNQEHEQLSNYMPCLANLESIATVIDDTMLLSALEIDATTDMPDTSASNRLERHQSNSERTFYSESKIVHRKNGVIEKSSPVLIQAGEHRDEELTTIAQDPNWPSVTKLNKEGKAVNVAERSVQSSGIICIHTGTDQVRIKHATYLPLHNVISTIKVSPGSGFDILVHGTFHTDPGRAEVLSRTKTSESDQIRLDWNRILFSNYASQKLLPSVFHFIRNLSSVSKGDEDRIFSGLAAYRTLATEIFGDEAITAEHQIVHRRHASGDDSFELIEASTPVFHLPNLISKHKDYFEHYGFVLDNNVWTTHTDKGVLADGTLPCVKPLTTFGLLPALDADDERVLSYLSMLNGLAGLSYVQFDKDSEGPLIATYHRATTGRGYRVDADNLLKCLGLLNPIQLVVSHFTMFVPIIGGASDLFIDTNIVITESGGQPNKVYLPSTHRAFVDEIASKAQSKLQSDSKWTVKASHLLLEMLRTQSLEQLRLSVGHIVPVQTDRDGTLELWSFDQCFSATAKGQLSQHAAARGVPGLWNLVRFDPIPVIYGIPHNVSDSYKIGRDPSETEIIRQINQQATISDHFDARSQLASCLLTYGENKSIRDESVKAAFRLISINFANEDKPYLLPSKGDPEIVTDILSSFGYTRLQNAIPGAIEILEKHSKVLESDGVIIRSTPDLVRGKVAAHDSSTNISFDDPLQVRTYLRKKLFLGNEFIRRLPVYQTNKNNFVVLGSSEDLFVLPAEQSMIVHDYDVEVIEFDSEYMFKSDISPFAKVCNAIIKSECKQAAPTRRITSKVLSLWGEAKTFVTEEGFVKSVCDYLMPVALEGGKVWETDSEFPLILSQALRTAAGITFFSEANHPDAARILNTFDAKYRFVLLRKLDADFLTEHSDRINPELWFDYWQDIASDLSRSEIADLTRYAKSIKDDVLTFALPIHKTNQDEYVQVGSRTNILVCGKETKWISTFDEVFVYVPATPFTESLAAPQDVLFDTVKAACPDELTFANVLRANLEDVKQLLMDESFITRLRPLPIFGTDEQPADIDHVLAEVNELEESHLPLCQLLNYQSHVEPWVKNTQLYQQTRRPLSDYVDTLCSLINFAPEFSSAGIGPLADLDYLASVSNSLRKTTAPLFNLLGHLLDASDKFANLASKVVKSLHKVSISGIVDLLQIIKSAPIGGNNLPKPVVAAIALVIANPGQCADFPVVSATNEWVNASLTALRGANIPDERKLHGNVLADVDASIPCFTSEVTYPDFAGLFSGSPVWAEYDFLVGTITALIGYTTRDIAFADESLGESLDITELRERAPELPKPIRCNFIVRHTSAKTEFRSCAGSGIEVLTPDSELISLIDEIVFNEDAATVYFVIPDAYVDYEVVSNNLVQLIATLYASRVSQQQLDDITEFVNQYRSRGQSAIRQVQGDILASLSSYLHKLGIHHVSPELRTAVSNYVAATNDVIKYSNMLVSIRSRRDTMSKEEFTAKNSDISKQLFGKTRNRNDAEQTLHLLLEGSDPDSLMSQSSTVQAFRETNREVQLQPDSVFRSLLDLATVSMRNSINPSDDSAAVQFGIALETTDTGDVFFGYEGKPINEGAETNPYTEFELMYLLDPIAPTQKITSKALESKPMSAVSGLGFSCVHLVTDKVSIASKDLVTDVIGGFWPKVPDRHFQQQLRTWRSQMGLPSDATVIKLHQVSQPIIPSETQLLYTLCFSEYIRWMAVQTGSIRTEFEKLHARSYGQGISLNTVKVSTNGQFVRNQYFLAVRSKAESSEILLPLNNDGAFHEDGLAEYWCGQPVRNQEFAGFAINAMFPMHADYFPVVYSDNASKAVWSAAAIHITNCKAIIAEWVNDHATFSSFCQDAELKKSVTKKKFIETILAVLESSNA